MSKTVPKKLHGQDKIIQVSEQIIRWRKENRKTGRTIGRHMEFAKKHAKATREERALPDPTKKKWF